MKLLKANSRAGKMQAAVHAALALAMIFSSLPASPAYAGINNVLGNPGFESSIGGARNWDNTAGRGISIVSTGAPEGASFLRLDESQVVGEFPFTFQTVTGVNPGDIVSFSVLGRETALQGGDADDDGQIVIEFRNSGGLISSVIQSLNSGAFTRVTARGVAPTGVSQVVFVLRIQGAENDGSGTSIVDFDDARATVSQFPLALSASASSGTTTSDDMTMVMVDLDNVTVEEVRDIDIVAEPQGGLTIARSEAALDGTQINTGEGSVIFNIGTLAAQQERVLTFPVILTAGVVAGKSYEIELYARNQGSGVILSDRIRIVIKAELDPIFEQGTIIGKVFHDRNQNTVQDPGEEGVPWTKLVTEEGIMVVTDEHGRYSIPGVKPGRHLIKIDGHSLPEGTKFITEETFLVKTTPGIMNRANFAVLLPPSDIPEDFQDKLNIRFTQGLDTSRPVLEVTMTPDTLKTGLGTLEKDAVFKFHLNYPDFVRNWYLEVRDETGEEIWTGFGVGAPPSEVTWTGIANDGLVIKPGVYSYQFKVEDTSGRQDWTTLNFFRVISKADDGRAEYQIVEIPSVGNFNIFKDGKSSIPLVAKPTIRIQGKTLSGYEIRVNDRVIPVNDETGRFHTEFYVTPGEKDFLVQAISPSGEVTSYRKTMLVKDSTFFLVALGEEEFGATMESGNLETAGNDDNFKDGFYEDGRLSYFLKGKLKGKFFFESHYDTDDNRSALFRNLDPDEYYPVYGDDSIIDYDAINTRQKFYLLVEMDRSFVKWGSYETAFNDTELASYNRTLSGFKGHYESTETTSYGDAKRGVTAFWAEARHRADHNEFAATGGSLYYLRHRNVIEGSEKVRVIIRDKIQDIPIDSYDLAEGADYEIDYDEGRVLLNRPLTSVAASDTLVSADILDGSPVFLVVDYEYDAGPNTLENSNQGIRGFTHMGDHIRVGATAIKEDRGPSLGEDYDMRAVDMQIKLGRNTKINAEYAESKREQQDFGVSFNGGLTFLDLNQIRGNHTRPRENAYLIKGQTKPVEAMEISGYVQGVEPSFSNGNLRSFEEGTKKYGVHAKYELTDNFYARYRFDSSEIVGQLLPVENHGIVAPYETRRTHIGQLVYDDGKWLGIAEYYRRLTDFPRNEAFLLDTLLSEYPFENAIGLKLGYRVEERLFPYLKLQTSFEDDTLYQAGAGLRYQIANDIFAYFEQMFGNVGDSTLLGVEKWHDGRTRTYSNLRMRDQLAGTKVLSTTIGSSYSLTEKSRIYSEREHSSYDSINGYADILGYQGKAGDRWDYDLRYERRHIDQNDIGFLGIASDAGAGRATTFNTLSGALGYAEGEKLRARTFLEVRLDKDGPNLWQWVSRNAVEYRINQDLRYLGRLDFGKTRFTNDPEDNAADFLEFNTGFAYRPIEHDRFNMLTKYSFLRNMGNDAQFLASGIEVDQGVHIISIDMAYELHRYLELVEKLAYKNSTLDSSVSEELRLHQVLVANRLNFHVTRKWDIALEYRLLWQFNAARNLKHGALFEVDRELYDYVRLGLGYNFTDFDDDLRKSNNYDAHGPFVRMTGKF